MTTITRLREKLAACEKLIEAENAARPKSPRKGVKPPPPSVEAQRLAAELRNASAELAEAIPPARDEYDRLVSAKKEEFAEAIKKAMLPFFGGSLDLLARRQLEQIHIPLRDMVNQAFSRTFSPNFHDDPTPENLARLAKQHLSFMDQWASHYGFKI
jgi:hypothetical protein